LLFNAPDLFIIGVQCAKGRWRADDRHQEIGREDQRRADPGVQDCRGLEFQNFKKKFSLIIIIHLIKMFFFVNDRNNRPGRRVKVLPERRPLNGEKLFVY
jgi:hypothetical protein